MKKRNIVFLSTGLIFAIIITVMMYKYGIFHSVRSWDEYQFIGKNLEDLRIYAQAHGNKLFDVPEDELSNIAKNTGIKLLPSQRLYMIDGHKRHEFSQFPSGKKVYFLYVVVDKDGKIVFYHEEPWTDWL